MRNVQPEEAARYQPGCTVSGRYRVLEPLGWGAAGYVLKVADTFLNDQPCALKILLKRAQQDETTMARFRREVTIARSLGHPNIVRVFDIGRTDVGDPFVSMECVEGMTLHKVIAMGSIETSQAFTYLRGIAEGLAYAHRAGIIHRDLKPSNIMVDTSGTPKVTDFGTAKASFSEERLTRPDELIGSPLYISPEAIKTGEIDQRSDIYAFGAIAFTIFEDAPPFFHPNWAALAHMHVSAPIPSMTNERCPLWCRDMITRCLHKDPNERFQSFDEILSSMNRYHSLHYSQRPLVSRSDLLKVGAGIVIGGVLSTLLF